MSYREVDAAIIARVCADWLAEFKKEVDDYVKRMEQISWTWRPSVEDRQFQTKELYSHRVYELQSLAKCPASLNRIVKLDAKDCYILFEVYK
jgi:hypothetical protein